MRARRLRLCQPELMSQSHRYHCELTHSSNNLRLKTELVLETTSKVGHTAPTIACHIWHLANVVVHVSASEKEDSDQADCSPEVAVLDDREDVWGCDREKTDRTGDSDNGRDDLDIVDGAHNRWVRRIWKVS